MKIALVNSKDVTDKPKNPDKCLSALRATGECHKCDKIAKEIIDSPLDLILKNLNFTCKPKLSKENKAFLVKYDELLQEKENIQDEIDNLRKQHGLDPE